MSSNILSLIRATSMPIHKKLDRIGISTHINNNTINKDTYLKWLKTTYQFMTGYDKLIHSATQINSEVLCFCPPSLHISHLRNDILRINKDETLPRPLDFPMLVHRDLITIPVYTLLGSLLGSMMIYRHITTNVPELPVSFLKAILENPGDWQGFKTFIKSFQTDLEEQTIVNYTQDFWNIIHTNYLSCFASVPTS